MRPLRLLLPAIAAAVLLPATSAAKEPSPWCAPGIEALPGDVCRLDGEIPRGQRRTLVIFLHGAVAKNTTWQWNHMRGLDRLAKGNHVDVIFPRSPLADVGYVWPGSLHAQEAAEQALFDEWMTAKKLLEQRGGRYDEVFVMGFSSGAYFVSSLAMRGRLDVDGYAVFAGGQAMGQRSSPVERWSPVFVGVCSQDEGSAAHSRAFGGALAAAGIPRAVMEQPVGHGLSHVHFGSALRYLRRANASTRTQPQPLASR